MSVYRVTYQSMTAFYGPDYIEAEDEDGGQAHCQPSRIRVRLSQGPACQHG